MRSGTPFSMESGVRMYSRQFPCVFRRAQGSVLTDEDSGEYLDFFSGAGAVNYGHNPPEIVQALRAHLEDGGILHGLDLMTTAKRDFIEAFHNHVLRPRGLNYTFQFCGPTGADAVEAAVKLSARVTGRTRVLTFAGAFHGMTAGARALSGHSSRHDNPLGAADRVMVADYDRGADTVEASVAQLERLLEGSARDGDRPGAMILEGVQIQGGVHPPRVEWVRAMRELATAHGMVMIWDDVQAGCGRTGTFFSFEHADVTPDVVVLAKSIGGCGLPLALVLIQPELDVWSPGEHTGTFRGNQLALVAGAVAAGYWHDAEFLTRMTENSEIVGRFAASLAQDVPEVGVRSLGLLAGIDFAGLGGEAAAAQVQHRCFAEGVLVEICGTADECIKLMPPLNTPRGLLEQGLGVVEQSVAEAVAAYAAA